MKSVVVAFALLAVIVLASASPVDKAKRPGSECLKACAQLHAPLCAYDPNDSSARPRTFSNQCALDAHNCLNKSNLVKKQAGACPGSQGENLGFIKV